MSSLTQSIIRSLRKPLIMTAAFGLSMGTTAVTHADSVYAPSRQYASAQSSRLSIEQLGQALADYGANTVTDNNVTFYTLNIARGTWKFSLTISLSPNGSVIWMTAPLTRIPDPNSISPVALANLLAKNAELGPTFFEIAGTNHMIQLERPVANNDLTVEAVRANVEALLATIQKTESLWSKQTLLANGAAPQAAQPAVSALGLPLR